MEMKMTQIWGFNEFLHTVGKSVIYNPERSASIDEQSGDRSVRRGRQRDAGLTLPTTLSLTTPSVPSRTPKDAIAFLHSPQTRNYRITFNVLKLVAGTLIILRLQDTKRLIFMTI